MTKAANPGEVIGITLAVVAPELPESCKTLAIQLILTQLPYNLSEPRKCSLAQGRPHQSYQ